MCACTSSAIRFPSSLVGRAGRAQASALCLSAAGVAAAIRVPEGRCDGPAIRTIVGEANAAPTTEGNRMPRSALQTTLATAVAAAAIAVLAATASRRRRPSDRCLQARRPRSRRRRANSSRWRCRSAPGAGSGAIARNANPGVLTQVSEADVGRSVVLVFQATGRGTTRIAFGLTLGERAKAYESRFYTVKVA